MFNEDLIDSITAAAKAQGLDESDNQQQDIHSRIIKVIHLEQYSDKDIKDYLNRLCTNPMAIQSFEIFLSIIRLYEFQRLDKHPHINNPQAIALLRDMENFLLQQITCILQKNKYDLVMNMSKVDSVVCFLRKSFKMNLCQKLKMIFRKSK